MLALVAACLMLTLPALPALAQQKEQEPPFWAIGRPKSGPGAQMAPVPAFPVPTPADKLPIAKMEVPEGFKVGVYAAEILDARGLRQGDKGTVFVSSLFVASKLYAIVERGGKREVKTLAEKLFLPNGSSSTRARSMSRRRRRSAATRTSRTTSTSCRRRW